MLGVGHESRATSAIFKSSVVTDYRSLFVQASATFPPADDWWWNWQERCRCSYLLYHVSPSAWAADELWDQLRRVLRIAPENEAIEIGTGAGGWPLARFKIPCVGNVEFQARGSGTVYSPPVTCFDELGWTLKLWEFELHN